MTALLRWSHARLLIASVALQLLAYRLFDGGSLGGLVQLRQLSNQVVSFPIFDVEAHSFLLCPTVGEPVSFPAGSSGDFRSVYLTTTTVYHSTIGLIA